MEEVPGILRPTGGTKKFRRNCRLVAEEAAIAATDRNGRTTRFPLDASDDAPAKMMTYLQDDVFIILDRKGRGIVRGDYVVWDSAENTQFCELAHLENAVTNTYDPAQLRSDAVRLEEPMWLRRYVRWAPYVLAGGTALAPIGRAFDLPPWLVLPLLPWLLMYPVIRCMGYFAPQRIGLSDIEDQEKADHGTVRRNKKSRTRKATTP